MSDNRVDTTHVKKVSGSTIGLYLISLVNGERTFSYWRNNSAATLLGQNINDVEHAVKKQDMIYFSGITLAILDPSSRNNLFSCLKSARRAGKNYLTQIFDQSFGVTKEMCDVIMAGANLSDIILPSFDDEATWFLDANPMATLKRYQKVGAEIVVVKNAGEPVSFISNQGIGTHPVQSIEQLSIAQQLGTVSIQKY